MSGGQLDGQPIKVLDELWKKQGWANVVPIWQEDSAEELRWGCTVEVNGKEGNGRGATKRDARIRASSSLLEKLGVRSEATVKDEKLTRRGIERLRIQLEMREAELNRKETKLDLCLKKYLRQCTKLETTIYDLNSWEASLEEREARVALAERKMKKRKLDLNA